MVVALGHSYLGVNREGIASAILPRGEQAGEQVRPPKRGLLERAASPNKEKSKMAIFSALLGAGVSLLSGILGKKKAKPAVAPGPQRSTTSSMSQMVANPDWEGEDISETVRRADLGAMNAAALSAGFNPLSVLRAGGMGFFGDSTTRNSAPQFIPRTGAILSNTYTEFGTPGSQATAGTSMGQIVGGALQTGFNIWNNQPSQLSLAGDQLRNELMQAQIKGINAGISGRSSAGGASGVLSTGAPSTPTGSTLWGGVDWLKNPWFDSASNQADQWGEGADWLAIVTNPIADVVYTGTQSNFGANVGNAASGTWDYFKAGVMSASQYFTNTEAANQRAFESTR